MIQDYLKLNTMKKFDYLKSSREALDIYNKDMEEYYKREKEKNRKIRNKTIVRIIISIIIALIYFIIVAIITNKLFPNGKELTIDYLYSIIIVFCTTIILAHILYKFSDPYI